MVLTFLPYMQANIADLSQFLVSFKYDCPFVRHYLMRYVVHNLSHLWSAHLRLWHFYSISPKVKSQNGI